MLQIRSSFQDLIVNRREHFPFIIHPLYCAIERFDITKLTYFSRFHGDMTRSEAEDLLSEAVDGAYFVRRSKNLLGKVLIPCNLLLSTELITYIGHRKEFKG